MFFIGGGPTPFLQPIKHRISSDILAENEKIAEERIGERVFLGSIG